MFHFSYFSITSQDTDLVYCAVEWFVLKIKRDPSYSYTSSDLSASSLHQLWKDTKPHRKIYKKESTISHIQTQINIQGTGNRKTGNVGVSVAEEPVFCMKYRDFQDFMVKSPFWSAILYQFSSVQSFSRVRLFATPWIAAHQASLSNTNSRSSLELKSIECMMPSSHLILYLPLILLPSIFPSMRVFSNESTNSSQEVGKALEFQLWHHSFQSKQDWSPLEWTGWISLQSKALSRVFSNTTVQKHQFFRTQLSSQSNSDIHTWLLEKP